MKEKIFIPAFSGIAAGTVGFLFLGGFFPGLIALAAGSIIGYAVASRHRRQKKLQAPESQLDAQYHRINTIAVSIIDKQVSGDLKSIVSSIKKMRNAGAQDADLYIRFQEALSIDVPKILSLAEIYFKVGGKGLGSADEKAQLPRIQSELSSYANSFETKCLALKADTLADKIDLLEADKEMSEQAKLEDFDRKIDQ